MRYLLLACLLFAVLPAHAGDLPSWLAQRLDAITPISAPAFIASYDVQPDKTVFDKANANAAFTYDESLAICAYLASGDIAHARRIGDALLWAQDHDRFYHDGRLRNAYAAGLAIDNPVKLPGYWDADKKQWIEDGYQAGSATGNNAWAGIALMRLSLASGDQRYAEGARRIGHWLVGIAPDWNTDSAGVLGLRGGFEDFETNPTTLTWRSTEHNVDALALFRLLSKAYPKDGFDMGISETSGFLRRMWSGKRFEVGTTADGKTVNKAYSALDAQILPLLASPLSIFEFDNNAFQKALSYAQQVHGVPGGFDYTDKHDGVWAEGTAQAALLYRVMGNSKEADALITVRKRDAGPDGGIYTVQGIDGALLAQLSTGLQLGNGGKGEPWAYYRRVAVAPVAWLIMAENGYNPLAAPVLAP